MRKHLSRRLLSLLLVIAMLFSFAVPMAAAEEEAGSLSFRQVDNSAVSVSRPNAPEQTEEPIYADTDRVRVSIVLEQASTLEAGFSTRGIGSNEAALRYRQELQAGQEAMTARISQTIGQPLEVAWNLTLAANLISATVAYGQIDAIAALPGVKAVVPEAQYEPQTGEAAAPNTLVSVDMTGTDLVWETGYTGAGSRIAIIDTGMQVEHDSFDPAALAYALEERAGLEDLSYEAYLEALDLLDAAEIEAVLPLLHAYEKDPSLTAETLYRNLKTPFAYNYVDTDLDVSHLQDAHSEHGSHVAGIAAANRYLRTAEGQFVPAADTVGVVGNAPDAQIIVMKVFGKNGGAYESDFTAAIEDAILLGCQAINLSLGSAKPGFATSSEYQAIMDSLVDSDAVVVISAGNSGYWAQESATIPGALYSDDVNFHTGGSPGSYTNAFTVASVDNDGLVDYFLTVAGRKIAYNESGVYSNLPMATLDPAQTGTEYDYIFVEGLGEAADYAGIDLEGKIVFCSRGVSSFAEKANTAAGLGAAAIVIYNNEDGSINMDLTGYLYTNPCVSIPRDTARFVQENSTEATTEDGLRYYTGTLTVHGSVSANREEAAYLTMSDFSSWGIPGDLSLKPEITAPGGSIYSVNGEHFDGAEVSGGADQYEHMSGTSMAAPQISGISVLLMQAIAARGIAQEGLSDRALAQSLLMSTATPLRDAEGRYYPLMQQGAGMVDAIAATSADSYVLVSGQEDGKVKAELGDDPQRTGLYSFDFTLNNLTAQEKTFCLSADVFTQDLFQDYANWNYSEEEMASYLDTATRPLGANVSWSADGQTVSSAGELDACDFDGDGDVDTDDGQALLDYVTGARASIAAPEAGDLDQDGGLDTYDVYLFLGRLGRDSVTVPANGSVTVTVTIELSAAAKALLDSGYPNGAYIQAYIYAKALSDAEGVAGTSHSIPMLAFYGNWSDASMFDVGSFAEYASGDETRLPYTGDTTLNFLMLSPGGDEDDLYLFGGNPVVPDETYLPQRNAINTARGDLFYGWTVSIIRNAANSRLTVTDPESGDTLFDREMGQVGAAFYQSTLGDWNATSNTLRIADLWTPAGLAEGSRFELKLTLAPEYYQNADGSTDWAALGRGVSLTTPVVVDNTAPTLVEASVNYVANTLTVSAQDNQYVAAVQLFNARGNRVLATAGAWADAVPGETRDYVLPLADVQGESFLIQVTDYAMNTTTYALDMQIGEEPELPEAIAYNLDFRFWTTVSKDTFYDPSLGLEIYEESDYYFTAATIADHVVFASTDSGALYAMPEKELSNTALVTDLGTYLDDMAYNAADGMIYGVCEEGALVRIDKLTGEMEYLDYLDIYTNTLACDKNGTFYCNELGTGRVYSFTLDTMELTPVVEAIMIDGKEMQTKYGQAMEINPNNGMLCWTSYSIDYYPYAYYIEVQPETGEYTVYNDLWDCLGALIIPEREEGGGWNDPTDQITGVWISHSFADLLKGSTLQLSAAAQPWTAMDRSVTWSSSDETVATVDANGLVTAVSAGEAVITAASVLDPSVTAACSVYVSNLEVTLEGALQDAAGSPSLFHWNLATDDTWTAGNPLEASFTSVTRDSQNNVLYVMDADGGFGMRKVDVTTGKTLETAANLTGVPLWDMEYSQVFSTAGAPRISGLYYNFFFPCQDPMALDTEVMDLQELLDMTGADYFVALASGGYEPMEGQDTELFYLLDSAGYLWMLWIYAQEDGSYAAYLDFYQTNLTDLSVPGNGDHLYCSMVMGEDWALYLSLFDGSTNVLYRMEYDWSAGNYLANRLDDMGTDIWPAALYAATSNTTAQGNRQVPHGELLHIVSEQISLETLSLTPRQTASRTARTVKDSTMPAAPAAASCQSDTLTLTLTADAATNNGLITVAYDAQRLVLTDVSGRAALHSYSDRDGLVTFGYTDLVALPAQSTLATLTFTAKETGKFDFTVTTVEEGRTAPGTATVTTLTVGDCPAANYTDVPLDAWYHDYVDAVLAKGLMQGVNAAKTQFAPAAGTTRAMLVTTLYRLAGAPEVTTTSSFTDVAEDTWYAEAVAWAQENGIVNGVSATAFAPNALVTREQAATILYRYVTVWMQQEPAAGTELSGYNDAGRISAYARDAVAWATAEGFFQGFPDGSFQPGGTLTRAQTAKLLALLDAAL